MKCHNKKKKKAPGWKGGESRHTKGYITIHRPTHPKAKKHPYVMEHRLIMEKKLGRYLKDGENVHHVNGIRNDNRIENLELWTRPHPCGIRVRDAVKWAKEIIETYGEDETKY